MAAQGGSPVRWHLAAWRLAAANWELGTRRRATRPTDGAGPADDADEADGNKGGVRRRRRRLGVAWWWVGIGSGMGEARRGGLHSPEAEHRIMGRGLNWRFSYTNLVISRGNYSG